MTAARPKKTRSELAGSRVKLSFRRHALPFLAGLGVFVIVFGFFNSELLSGQIAYYFYSRHLNVNRLDTNTTFYPVDKNAAPRIIINKINVTAPVIFETRNNENVFLQDLHNGVVHYPDTANPGETGNVVIFGHSSGQWWAPGNYKFIFTLLNKLQFGDKIFVEYEGVRYIYQVYNTKVVAPSDLTVLNQGGSHMLTLITCAPVGTSTNRLIIEAQQIVPAVSTGAGYTQPASLPTTVNPHTDLPSSTSFWDDFTQLLRHLF